MTCLASFLPLYSPPVLRPPRLLDRGLCVVYSFTIIFVIFVQVFISFLFLTQTERRDVPFFFLPHSLTFLFTHLFILPILPFIPSLDFRSFVIRIRYCLTDYSSLFIHLIIPPSCTSSYCDSCIGRLTPPWHSQPSNSCTHSINF